MNKFRPTINALAVVILTLMVTSFAHAQASRTWVSGVGDDVNPCSRTAPCKTFAGAISKTAANGEINAIDSGGFGSVTITKGMTIDGNGAHASILHSLTNGVIVNDINSGAPNSINVLLRNLSIFGGGNGLNSIRFLSGKTLNVENVVIGGITGNGIDAVLSGASPTGGWQLHINNVDINRLLGATSIGINLSAPASFLTATVNNTRVTRAPTGLKAGNHTFPIIRNSMFVSGTTGIEMLNAAVGGPRLTLIDSALDSNSTGLSAGSGTFSHLSGNSITQCSTGISMGGGTVQSSGDNTIMGNTSDGSPAPTIINPK